MLRTSRFVLYTHIFSAPGDNLFRIIEWDAEMLIKNTRVHMLIMLKLLQMWLLVMLLSICPVAPW